jgi:cytochrome c peroxidase
MQSLAPIENPDEMDEHFERVISKLNANTKYKTLFKNAFGDEQITGGKTLKAISQFMLTIVSANSLYDKMLRKEIFFNTQQENGYRLFKSNCASCHTEPLFTNGEFENNGLRIDTSLMDFGRMRVTQNEKDSLKFKVPTLRNIEFSYPYMHDGRFKKLSEVMNHYVSGVQLGPTLSKKLQKRIELTSNEKVDLTAFLLTLTDREFLFNQKYSYPK